MKRTDLISLESHEVRMVQNREAEDERDRTYTDEQWMMQWSRSIVKDKCTFEN